MKKIKNITVATDFSLTARNAYRYAKALAQTLDAALTIVHAKESIIIVSDVVTTPITPADDAELIKDIEELVAEEKASAGNIDLNQEVKIKILSGDPVTILTELSETDNTDLIVIGSSGLSDVLTKIFGSTSLKVSNKAHCPVIVVPRDAKWQPIEQILYASNYNSLTSEFAQDIIDFAVDINSRIHFVNIRDIDETNDEKQKDTDWNELFVATDSKLSYEKHTIYGNDTTEELMKYAEEKNINLMVFASKHRTFWENLTHKSISENVALSTLTPIMVVHLDDKR